MTDDPTPDVEAPAEREYVRAYVEGRDEAIREALVERLGDMVGRQAALDVVDDAFRAALARQATPASGGLDVDVRMARAAFVREAVEQFRRQRGRLSSVTVEDYLHILDTLAVIDANRAARLTSEATS